jgi:Flp pilus assembly protein TadG
MSARCARARGSVEEGRGAYCVLTAAGNKRAIARRPKRTRGQSLAEFSLVLTPLVLLLLGIIQFGFIFNAYVTVANASREGARLASIWVYDHALPKTDNDAARETAARDAVVNGMGLLSRAAPQLNPATDVVVTYAANEQPDLDARRGQHVTVAVTYHLDLFVPLVDQLLPRDGGGRMPINAEVTMVIN